MKTREAYNVIVKRIEAKIRDPNTNSLCIPYWQNLCLVIASYILSVAALVVIPSISFSLLDANERVIVIPVLFFFAIFIFFFPFAKASCTRTRNKKEAQKVKEVAILRRNAAGPSSALNLPNKKWFGGNTFNDSPQYYGGAAACGVWLHRSPDEAGNEGVGEEAGGEDW